MNKELLELIAIIFWQDHDHCGSDFDAIKCKDGDYGECTYYTFCRIYTKLKNQV